MYALSLLPSAFRACIRWTIRAAATLAQSCQVQIPSRATARIRFRDRAPFGKCKTGGFVESKGCSVMAN